MAVLDGEPLAENGAFYKFQGDGHLQVDEGAYPIADTVKAGDPFFPDQLQALVKDRCCKPRLQLDPFQYWKEQRKGFSVEIIHVREVAED